MAKKKRNPFIPSERAMEMDDRTTIDEEESKRELAEQQSRADEDLIPTRDSEAAAKKPLSETRDPNQPRIPRPKK